MCSYNKSGTITYAYGSEAVNIIDATAGAVVSDAQSSVTGTVTDFTKDLAFDYTITVTMDEPVAAEELVGRYIYVENDGVENAAYRIHDAEVNGNTAVLNLNNQDLIREFVDSSNMDLGYVYNIAEGQSYNIPLSSVMICAHEKNRVSYSTNGDGTHNVIRNCTVCNAVTSVTVAACKDGTDANTLCDRCNGQLPVQIATAEDLIAFAEQVNAGGNTVNATLIADIDLTGYDWTPIGTVTYPYKGVFSGGGFTVKGMNITHVSVNGEDYRLGLFGNTLGATVKDLTVQGSITLSGTASGASRIGGIIAHAASTTMQNCINKVTITGVNDSASTGFYNIGGLVGYAYGVTIQQCGNDADLDITGINVGGLVGTVAKANEPTTITECYNHGDVYGYSNVGGLVGNLLGCGASGKNNTVINCYSSGDFGTRDCNGVERCAGGGLIGAAPNALCVVKNCYVSGGTTIDVREDGDYTDKAIIYNGYAYNITNNWLDLYYLEGVSQAETYDITMGKSHEEMIDQEFVDTLGSSFKAVENRYPVLVWECSHPDAVEGYADNGDGTHNVTFSCPECGEEEFYTEVCKDNDADDYCDSCGGSLVVIDDVQMILANMTLGNELMVNFMIVKSELDPTQAYKAVLTRYEADGVTVDETIEIPSAKWEVYAGQYYKVSMGVAAKEMCNNITVEIFDSEGNAVEGGTRTESIRSYAMRVLTSDQMADNVKVLVVDMLNYGAYAQTYFEYNTEELANSQLTDEQKALASGEYACTNSQQKIKNYYASRLSLEQNIIMQFTFLNCPADTTGMYGEITFTSHTGKEQSVAIAASDLQVMNSTNKQNLCLVTVDEIVLADASQPITVTIYNADGTIYGQGVDSVESYACRSAGREQGEIAQYMMRFANSAYEYLHNR